MSNEPRPDGDGVPATAPAATPAYLAHVGRGLRVVGWVMMVWSGLVMGFGFVFGRPVLLVFYPLLFVMGWQAVSVASRLRTATTEEAAAMIGRGYVRQGWLVLAWIVLGLATALYLGWSAEQQ
jgi:hypothetical protein